MAALTATPISVLGSADVDAWAPWQAAWLSWRASHQAVVWQGQPHAGMSPLHAQTRGLKGRRLSTRKVQYAIPIGRHVERYECRTYTSIRDLQVHQ